MPDSHFILIGKIVGVHGIAGGLKLKSFAESRELFAPELRLKVISADGSERLCAIGWVKPQGRSMLMGFKEVTHRSQAEALVGCELFIEKSALPVPEAGSYYWSDLIGLAVYAVQGAWLGRLESIFRTGSNDVYVVKRPGKELLIPALKTVIVAIDLAAGRMEVDLPEGLD